MPPSDRPSPYDAADRRVDLDVPTYTRRREAIPIQRDADPRAVPVIGHVTPDPVPRAILDDIKLGREQLRRAADLDPASTPIPRAGYDSASSTRPGEVPALGPACLDSLGIPALADAVRVQRERDELATRLVADALRDGGGDSRLAGAIVKTLRPGGVLR